MRTKFLFTFALALAMAAPARATETCFAGNELDAATRSAVEAAAQRFFTSLASGNAATLKQAASPALPANVIDAAVNDTKDMLGAAQWQPKSTYLLTADGTAPIERAEFYCGVWKTPGFVGFALQNLPPGRYAIVIGETTGANPHNVSFVLQQTGGQWKLGGLFPKAKQVNGKDAQWYAHKARAYNQAGNKIAASMYYFLARDMMAPVPFMATDELEKFDAEVQGAQPQLPMTVSADGKQFRINQMFPVAQKDGLYLVVKHEAASVADTGKSALENTALITALVKQNPALREAFSGVVARAVEPSGQDYGTLLAMKDVK
jgi:hypothetical protein